MLQYMLSVARQHAIRTQNAILLWQIRPSIRPSVEYQCCVYKNGHTVRRPQGVEVPASPGIEFVGTSCMHARTQYEKQQPNFGMVIKLDVRKIFLLGQPRMLTRDLFARS